MVLFLCDVTKQKYTLRQLEYLLKRSPDTLNEPNCTRCKTKKV